MQVDSVCLQTPFTFYIFDITITFDVCILENIVIKVHAHRFYFEILVLLEV